MRYDQTHYMWALKQLTEVSGWGIHASSEMSPEFIVIAGDACKGIRPAEDALGGEVISFNSRWNCFVRVGVTYCASIENDRTNYLCHLLVPEDRKLQTADELFFETVYADEKADGQQLEKLSVQPELNREQYHSVLKKYGMIDCENADRNLAKLLWMFYQSALRGVQDNRIIFGTFSDDYMRTAHEIMWLMHVWAGDEIALRRHLTCRVYADCAGTAFDFTSAGEGDDLVLGRAYDGKIGHNQPEEMMFLQLAENAQESPEKFLEAFRSLIKVYRESEVDELAYACIQMLTRYYGAELDGELLNFVMKRSAGKNRIAESYRKLYLTYESRKEGGFSYGQVKTDWRILNSSVNAAGLMEKYQDMLLAFLKTFVAADAYEPARKMLMQITKSNETVFEFLVERLSQGDSTDWIMTWHIAAAAALPMRQRMQYLKLILQLYDSVSDRILADPLVVDKVMILSGVYNSEPDKESISEYVLETLCPKVSSNQLLHDKWYELIETNTENMIHEKSLKYCVEHQDEIDPYALYPVCEKALTELENIYRNDGEPEEWQKLERIEPVRNRIRLLSSERNETIKAQIEAVKQAEREREMYVIRQRIDQADTVEYILEEIEVPDRYAGLWENWCRKLYECLEHRHFRNQKKIDIKDIISKIYKRTDFFRQKAFEISHVCIELLQNAVRLVGNWLRPGSAFPDMNVKRVEQISTYAWFCVDASSPEHGLMEAREAENTFWDAVCEEDFSQMYGAQLQDDQNLKKLREHGHITERLYAFYICYHTGELRNSRELKDFEQMKQEYRNLLNMIYREETSSAEYRESRLSGENLTDFLFLQKLREEAEEPDEQSRYEEPEKQDKHSPYREFYQETCAKPCVRNWFTDRKPDDSRLFTMWERLRGCWLLNESITVLSKSEQRKSLTAFLPECSDLRMIAELVSGDFIVSSLLKEQLQTIGLKIKELKECYNSAMTKAKNKKNQQDKKLWNDKNNKKYKEDEINKINEDLEKNSKKKKEVAEEKEKLQREKEELEKKLASVNQKLDTLEQTGKELTDRENKLNEESAFAHEELKNIDDGIRITEEQINQSLSEEQEIGENQKLLEESEQNVNAVREGKAEKIREGYIHKPLSEEVTSHIPQDDGKNREEQESEAEVKQEPGAEVEQEAETEEMQEAFSAREPEEEQGKLPENVFFKPI